MEPWRLFTFCEVSPRSCDVELFVGSRGGRGGGGISSVDTPSTRGGNGGGMDLLLSELSAVAVHAGDSGRGSG